MNATEVPIAAVCGVRKTFQDEDGRERVILEGVDFEVRKGEVVAVLGPSGCGKSTLLRILIGLIPPSAGRVLAHGAPLAGINPGAAVVFQSFALFPWLSVEENVRIGLTGRNLPDADAAARVRDVMTAELLRAEVYRLWSDGGTGLSSVLLITHLIEEAVTLADRIVILGANPGTVRREIPNTLPHPREPRHPEFLRMVERIHDALTGVHLPEEEAPPPTTVSGRAAIGPFVPLPPATVGEMLGLLEILADHGGDVEP